MTNLHETDRLTELLADIRNHIDDLEYVKLLRPEIEAALTVMGGKADHPVAWITDAGLDLLRQGLQALALPTNQSGTGIPVFASPVQARTGEVTVPVEALLAIRDALVVRDVNEAYHHLYRIADPTFCEMKPWADLEAALSEPSKA